MISINRTRAAVMASAALTTLSLFAIAPSRAADSSDALVRALQSRVQTLEDREAIHKLLDDYGRLIDERNFDAFAQLWAKASEYDSAGTVTKGPAAIAGFLKDIIGRNPSGFGTPNFHVFFNETVEVNGDTATARSKAAFMVPAEGNKPSMVMLANYHDELVREDGRWKFLKRVVRGDIPAPKR